MTVDIRSAGRDPLEQDAEQAFGLGRAPPTGAPFETHGLDMVRVRDGQLVEHWAFAGPMRPR
jgi:hypothetical protein